MTPLPNSEAAGVLDQESSFNQKELVEMVPFGLGSRRHVRLRVTA
jgi:hypothetical protein